MQDSHKTIEEQYIDSTFRMAVLLAAKDESKRLMEEVKDEPKPSELETAAFRKRIDREYAKSKRKKAGKAMLKVGSRVAVIIMICVTISFTLIMSVKAVRDEFVKLLLSFDPEYTQVEMQNIDSKGNIIEDRQPTLLRDGYYLSYVPEGFEMTSMTLYEEVQDVVYTNAEGHYINLTVQAEDAVTRIDSEDADSTETVTVNDTSAFLIEKNGVYHLVWTQDKYYMILASDLDKDEVLLIAKNIKNK